MSSGPTVPANPLDQEILLIYRQKGPLNAIKFYKDRTKTDLRSAKEHVDQLVAVHGLKKGGGGCTGVILLFVVGGVLYWTIRNRNL